MRWNRKKNQPEDREPEGRGEIEFVKDSGANLVSKNILSGIAPVRWMVRGESKASVDNGWIFFSAADDAAFTADMVANFQITSFNAVCNIEPAVIGIYDLPVGSDLELVRAPERMFFVDVKAGREIPTEMLYVPPQHRQ